MKAIKRFLKRRWWIIAIALAVWLFPQAVLAVLPTIFMFALQLALNILMFGLMFFYLASRTRVETYLPGDLDYSWDDYRGHPEIVEKAKLWVQLLKGIEEFESLGGHHVGGILLVGPPGSGKCVAGDTLVRTSVGLVPIRELATGLNPGETRRIDLVVDSICGVDRASHIYYDGEKEVLEVIVEGNFSVKTTLHHRFLTCDEAGDVFWKRACELEIGDLVALKRKSHLADPIVFGFPNPDDAYIMGLLTGDGQLARSKYWSGAIPLSNSEPALVKIFKEWAAAKGIDVKSYGDTHKAHCKRLALQLERWGLSWRKSKYREVPWTIMQGPRSLKRAFLRGLFDAEADERIEFGTTSEALYHQVKLLLLEFGILARASGRIGIYRGYPFRQFRLWLTGENARRYLKEIGFCHPRKKKQARVERFSEVQYFGNKLPVAATKVLDEVIRREKERKRGQKLYSRRQRIYFRGNARRFGRLNLKLAKRILDNEEFPELERLVQQATELVFLPVKEIKRAGRERVYDLVVPLSHAFVGNGFVLHNTYLAKIVAAQAGVPFVSVDAATLQATFVGVAPLRVIQVFRRARRLARDYGACILCLDEIDAIGRSRTGMQPHRWGIPWGGWWGGGLLTTLFIELDGLREARGRIWRIKKQIWKLFLRRPPKWKWPKVMVMAMTNVPELLDPALTRPGRLSRQIKIDPPTLEGAKDIIEYYLQKVTHDATVTVEKLALDAIGQVPAKIEEAINTALELAYASGRKAMSYWDWRHALNELVLGLRQPVPWEERDRQRLAYHEAGHAVVTWLLQRKDYRITSCSIVRYGSALGHLTAVPTSQLFVKSVEEASASLAVLIGGRAAEELVFGMPMGSLGGDMKAIRSVLTWMAEHGMFRNYRLGQETSEALQEEMNKFLRRVREETIELLRRNKHLLDALASELMQREEIIGEEVEKLLEEVANETNVLNNDSNSERSCRVLDLSASSSASADR